MLDIIAFDADDTLWHNEPHFTHTHEKFRDLLSDYHDPEWIESRLAETEIRNLKHFGYGIKGFTLSMIETALELTENRIGAQEITKILDFGKSMLKAPLELMEGVEPVLNRLKQTHDLMIITKGDLFDQETKIARSGLGDYFKYVEVVSEKTPANFDRIVNQYQFSPDRFLMVGNSLKSDILPVIEIGAHAVYIPYETTWIHEKVDPKFLKDVHFHQVEDMASLPDFLRSFLGKKV